MRIARRLTLLALTAIAAIAFTASTATALDNIQVVNEATGTECSSITSPHTSGGCTVHMTGSLTLSLDLGIFGEAHELSCNIETQSRVSGNGTWAVDKVTLTPGEANCSNSSNGFIQTCDHPWEGLGEEDSVGTVGTTWAFCLNPAESSSDCIGTISFNIVEGGTAGAESSTVQTFNQSVGLCEIDMALKSESIAGGDSQVHVNHL